ncbi:iron ABC transporter permease [Myxococcota bacterium]|nr:iron ABC transporter permease [Myxococcota bacterium]
MGAGLVRELSFTQFFSDFVVSFLALFLFFPLIHVLREGFFTRQGFTLDFFFAIFRNPTTRTGIINSLVLALLTTLATFLITLPLAWLTVRTSFRGKVLLAGLLLLPLVLPPFVGAIGMRRLLARFGTLNMALMNAGVMDSPIDWLGNNKFWGVLILQTLHLFPIMYLNVVSSLANIDPSLEEAGKNMGASPFTVLRRITLPLAAPGIFAGSAIVFIWALTDLGTPLVFEYREVIPVLIFDRISDMGENPEGYALVVMVLLMTLSTYFLSKRLFGGTGQAMLTKNLSQSRERVLKGTEAFFARSLFLVVIFLSVLPHLSVLLTSVADRWFMTALPASYTTAHFREALAHELTVPSMANSIFYASVATAVDLFLGVILAWLVTRSKRAEAKYLDMLAMLPLALPGIVVAFGYVAAFHHTVLDPRRDPAMLLIIAYSVRRLPYVLRAAYAGFSQVSESLEEAALNLGATPARTLRRITLPLIGANLLAGGILAFTFALLEVSDSLILALKTNSFPITKAIYTLLGRVDDGLALACALGVWSMLFLGTSLLLANSILGKKMGELFR